MKSFCFEDLEFQHHLALGAFKALKLYIFEHLFVWLLVSKIL